MLSSEHIKRAAFCCCYPTADCFLQSLIFVVEELVLPNDVGPYTREDMQKYITQALEAAQQSV